MTARLTQNRNKDSMFNNILKKIFGDQSERAVRPLWNRLKTEINPISEQIRDISNDEAPWPH